MTPPGGAPPTNRPEGTAPVTAAEGAPPPAAPVVSAGTVTVGDLVTVGEADYCYGTGPLRLRLTAPPIGLDRVGLEWVELTGVPLHPDGSVAQGGRSRTVLVRVAALHRRFAGPAR